MRRIDDFVGDAPGSSGADDATRRHAHSVQLVKGIAHGRGDLTWLVNVPGEAADIIALAHGQDQHVGT